MPWNPFSYIQLMCFISQKQQAKKMLTQLTSDVWFLFLFGKNHIKQKKGEAISQHVFSCEVAEITSRNGKGFVS